MNDTNNKIHIKLSKNIKIKLPTNNTVVPFTNVVMCGSCQTELAKLPAEHVDLIVTSPPYWTLKRYNEGKDQLGHVEDYEVFLAQLEMLFRICVM